MKRCSLKYVKVGALAVLLVPDLTFGLEPLLDCSSWPIESSTSSLPEHSQLFTT